MIRWLMRFILVALVAAGALLVWLQRELATPYFGAAEPEVFVEVPRGASSDRISRLLQEHGVLRYRLPFALHLLRTGAARHLKAGEYRFAHPATPVEVADRLMRGDVYSLAVTVPEGLTSGETLAQVEASGLAGGHELRRALARTDWIRDLDPEATSLEGYLFPETYRFPRNTAPDEIVRAMVDQFRAVFRRLSRESPPKAGWTPRAIVTLASMVEKEVRVDAERPLVASVLANRLALGMPLACDPTVVYALKLAGRYDGNIHKTDLALDSPYNTYLHAGLPPGPIANPGERSLRAALHPGETDFLYFVSRNDGTHVFSRDYAAHARAVDRFQRHASNAR